MWQTANTSSCWFFSKKQGCVMYYKQKPYSSVWQSTFCMLKVHNVTTALTYRTSFPLFRSHLKGQVTQWGTFSHRLLTLILLQIHMDFFYNLFMNLLKCQHFGGMEISQVLLKTMFLADQEKSDGFGRPWGWVIYDAGWKNSLSYRNTMYSWL